MITINAEDQVLGRIAAFAAKQAMLGNKVDVVNSEKAIVTGARKKILADYRRKREMGVPKKGPFIHRQAGRFVRRTIRGMIPYKTSRGRDAFKRVMCHVGVPGNFQGNNFAEIPKADIQKLTNLKYVQVSEICKELGGKILERENAQAATAPATKPADSPKQPEKNQDKEGK